MFHSRAFAGAVTGMLSAATVDIHAFVMWKSVQDITKWDWRTAVFRWVQGAVVGALTAAGYGTLIS